MNEHTIDTDELFDSIIPFLFTNELDRTFNHIYFFQSDCNYTLCRPTDDINHLPLQSIDTGCNPRLFWFHLIDALGIVHLSEDAYTTLHDIAMHEIMDLLTRTKVVCEQRHDDTMTEHDLEHCLHLIDHCHLVHVSKKK